MRSLVKLSGLILLVSCRCFADDCPSLPLRPEFDSSPISDSSRTLDPYSINHTVTHYYDAPLGIGFLQVEEEANQHYYDWMFELELPLWALPNSEHPLGWLSGGWIYTPSRKVKLSGAGMVETDYEHTSFIIWDTQGDWLKVKLNAELFAWVHRCQLVTAKLRLVLVSWETFFRRHKDWLHFRKPVPHLLRTAGHAASKRVTVIGEDHKLTLLDIRGDWMEVEVEQPDLTCRDPDHDEQQPATSRGWVKWRDEHGPWVYIYTRGC